MDLARADNDISITVPAVGAGRALFLIDIQPDTLSGALTRKVTDTILQYVLQDDYDVYVCATYYAPEDSFFFTQSGHCITEEKAGGADARILKFLQAQNKPSFEVTKTTRSIFKGSECAELINFLDVNQVDEIHFAGFDINDCVLASAYDSIDLGYYSFVIEELCHHNAGIEELKDAALAVLRRQKMTNNSLHDKIERKTVILSNKN